MKWSDIPFDPSRKTLRQFAGCWVVAFLAMAAGQFFLKHRPGWGIALGILALAVGIPGLLWPKLLRGVFVAWMVVAFPIGWAVSLILLALLYFLVLTPVAIFFRLRNRDILRRRAMPAADSFWEPKETPLDVRSYFRQY
jgi:hypothetical protein